ncbi:DUF397 domain-containing protein [Amycolatopsis sp. H20-H5]|uniref:DUF397 domain-containing protein n=1 Tax=Amycolatopsis sp. H20-H5 TaxID=3046309 RepID=UPI002DB654BF|nr:DUF397 domain-containing protein [Amycolatopsis sp. H20-H5]MEC3978791.1 DUF397 domain-containing protein [Amycolatopsis sp. H20-H5]
MPLVNPARCEWKKSAASSDSNACVEVALAPGTVGLRDTKARASGHLVIPADSWRALLRSVR